MTDDVCALHFMKIVSDYVNSAASRIRKNHCKETRVRRYVLLMVGECHQVSPIASSIPEAA